MSGSNAHLGVGWAFPVRPGPDGRMRWAREVEDVDQAIEIVLRTAPLERVMLTAFGAGLARRVFAPNTDASHRDVEAAVEDALRRWEPRIEVERVSASADPDQPTVMLVDIDYVVRRSNTRHNKVLPFYLTEGV